jgi:hypothetical protein
VVNTGERRGKVILAPSMTVLTEKAVKKRLHAGKRTAQRKTNARRNAESDPRSVYSEAVMHETFGMDIDPSLRINMDASTFIVCQHGNPEKEAIIIHDSANLDPITVKGDSELGFGIKYVCIANALGALAPPIFLINDSKLGVEEFPTPHKIVGLSHGGSVDSYGYLCFCKTRSGCDKFWRWVLTDVILPWICALRSVYSELSESSTFITIDGEEVSDLLMLIRNESYSP